MNDKNIYNDKNARGEFPKPGVPADDAWKQMHAMLVENNLTQPAKKDKRRFIIFWLPLSLLIAVGIAGYILSGGDAAKKKIISNTSTGIETKTNKSTVLYPRVAGNNNAKNDTVNTGLINSKSPVPVNHSTAGKQVYTLKDVSSISSSLNTIIGTKNYEPGVVSAANTNHTTQQILPVDDSSKNHVTSNNNSINSHTTMDTAGTNNNADTAVKSQAKNTMVRKNKFHFGLEWNAGFSLKNNDNYFHNYNSGKQYYMWLLPSAWAKFDINKRHGLLLTFNPYQQTFAGAQTVHIEKPWIASVEPDVVTRVIKTRALYTGINYTYQINKHFSVQAGGGYTFIRNVFYEEQAVEDFSGNILSEKIYSAKKKDEHFNYIKPSYASWNTGLQYNIKKISIGAGVNQSFSNLSADSNYSVRPLNGAIYLRYRFK